MGQDNLTFLGQLEKEILFIRNYLLSRIPQEKKDEFNQFEMIYEQIATQINNKMLSEQVAPKIYNQFLKTLKRFKRKQENILKFNERDVDAFRKRHEAIGQTIIPIIHDIKMNMSDRMNKFDIKKVLDFNFQMHLYTTKELADIAFQMFQYTQLNNALNVGDPILKAIINELSISYNVIPYHNWTHAFQLFHMYFTSYYNSEFKELIEPYEFFIGMISALAHDLNHKGVNNLYKVKRKAQTSLLYAEQAVLENMHVSTFFQIMNNNPQFDIFNQIKDVVKVNKFKRLFTSNIISTDMGRHSILFEQLKMKAAGYQKVRSTPPSTENLDKYLAFQNDKESDREVSKNSFIEQNNLMVHACDIGNPCYSFDNYMNWSYLLSQEFQDQTLKEEAKGVGVSTFLQYTNKSNFKKGQIFFSSTFVVPLWKELVILMPKLHVLQDTLNTNLKILADHPN